MKVLVKYHNKPHGIRLHNVHLVPVVRGVWLLHAELRWWQSQDVNSWGSDGDGTESVYFGDDDTHSKPEIRAQIKLVPGCPFEREPRLVDRLMKDTYEAVVVAKGVWSKSWDRYLTARERRVKRENKLRRRGARHGS
jgi:hypothetical protein